MAFWVPILKNQDLKTRLSDSFLLPSLSQRKSGGFVSENGERYEKEPLRSFLRHRRFKSSLEMRNFSKSIDFNL